MPGHVLRATAVYNSLQRLVDSPTLYSDTARRGTDAFLSDFTLTRVTVKNSRADGIHMTNGANHGTLINPVTEWTGEELIDTLTAGTGDGETYSLHAVAGRWNVRVSVFEVPVSDDVKDAVQQIVEDLQPNQRAWLRPSVPMTLHENTAIIAVPNDFTRNQLEGRLRTRLEDSLTEALGQHVRIAVTVDPGLDAGPDQAPTSHYTRRDGDGIGDRDTAPAFRTGYDGDAQDGEQRSRAVAQQCVFEFAARSP